MEFEVRHVAGIQHCFVSLPPFVIQTLQSTSSTLLPPLLTLELRSRAQDRPWVVAWSGATSSSTAIEVAQQFGECISLPNRISVQVRVLSNVPKATLVTIEPQTKDDWEVLELNPEHAEAAILKQLPVAGDVDLDTIANMTEGFSGADLRALLSDAQLAAVHEHLNSKNSNETGKLPLITDALLKSTASKATPSVSESEEQRLYGIYSQFLDSKRFVAARVLSLQTTPYSLLSLLLTANCH